MLKIGLAFALVRLSAAAAFAQTSFADLDTDEDRELGYAELQMAWPNLTQAQFLNADYDGSGALGSDEISAMQGMGTSTSGMRTNAAPKRQTMEVDMGVDSSSNGQSSATGN
jgi:hypothetical protein